jgi:hypothetical protein
MRPDHQYTAKHNHQVLLAASPRFRCSAIQIKNGAISVGPGVQSTLVLCDNILAIGDTLWQILFRNNCFPTPPEPLQASIVKMTL